MDNGFVPATLGPGTISVLPRSRRRFLKVPVRTQDSELQAFFLLEGGPGLFTLYNFLSAVGMVQYRKEKVSVPANFLDWDDYGSGWEEVDMVETEIEVPYIPEFDPAVFDGKQVLARFSQRHGPGGFVLVPAEFRPCQVNT